MTNILIGILLIGLSASLLAQNTTIEKLPEVVLHKMNYDYLHDVDSGDEAEVIQLLENKVANFDLRDLSIYKNEESKYEIYFMIQNGYILAHYNENGEIMRTTEHFRNIKVPFMVSASIGEKYPGWSISNNTYLVSYVQDKGATKTYKLILENGNHRIKVRTDNGGNIL